jgi:glycerate kinase
VGIVQVSIPEGQLTILVAPDSFKGSLSAVEAARAMQRGISGVRPLATVVFCPVSDGGEGFVEAVARARQIEVRSASVHGPMEGQLVHAVWGWDPVSKSAIVESAQAAGLHLIPPAKRSPGEVSTYGVGQLIRLALDAGAQEIVVGIGGTGTNDGGAGAAAALGVRFFNATGNLATPRGYDLESLEAVDVSDLDRRISSVRVIAATDVTNPLLGRTGAARIYSPQKGANPDEVERLERCMKTYADVVRRGLGKNLADLPGAGAGGGLPAGLAAFCDAEIRSGIKTVLEWTGFRAKLEGADLVLTGEGQLDDQTGFGKTLSGILQEAKAHKVPVAAIAGRCKGPRENFVGPDGLAAILTLEDEDTNTAEAMRTAESLLQKRTAELVSLLYGPD